MGEALGCKKPSKGRSLDIAGYADLKLNHYNMMSISHNSNVMPLSGTVVSNHPTPIPACLTPV